MRIPNNRRMANDSTSSIASESHSTFGQCKAWPESQQTLRQLKETCTTTFTTIQRGK